MTPAQEENDEGEKYLPADGPPGIESAVRRKTTEVTEGGKPDYRVVAAIRRKVGSAKHERCCTS